MQKLQKKLAEYFCWKFLFCDPENEGMQLEQIVLDFPDAANHFAPKKKVFFFRVGFTRYLSSDMKVFHWKIIGFLLCGSFLMNWSCGESAHCFKKSIFYNVSSLHNDRLDFVRQNFNLKLSTTTNHEPLC